MKEQPVTDVRLRQFLLGKVDDEERQQIEILFMTDPLSRERVLAAEQDLIEDYLEGGLATADRERFLLLYADTPEERRQLWITKSVKDWAVRESKVTQTGPAPISVWSRLRAGLRLKPVFVIPIAVTSMIAIMVAAVWLNRKTEQENRDHLAVEQELARLNVPSSLRQVPPQTSLELAPVSLRSVERPAELTTRADIKLVELRLLWIQKEQYPTYRAVIRRFGDDESLIIGDLHAETDGGNAIRIRLPAHILTRGVYQIQLIGIAADGATGLTEEYKFTVGG
jgi:hypothetical protein